MAINRRKFITTGAALSGWMLTPAQKLKELNTVAFNIPADFKIKVMATDWGFPGSREAYIAKARQEGYDGIEIWWQGDKAKRDELFQLLKKYNMEVGFLCGAHQSDFSSNFKQFTAMIDAATGQNPQQPLYVNCHSGKDFFSFEENKQFINYTIEASRKSGIPVSHETHRSRILFAAPVARQYMEAIPGLRVTLDISHWCNVHESFMEGQEDTVEKVLQRTDHIHARVGHPEGPQVNDPRAPEWETALHKHLAWWDAVIALKIKQGAKQITFLTEFGPPDYMPVVPYTRQPLADQWAINAYMMQLLKKRYSG
ncbi:MAG: sugar phosphate isomerase/epimerase [Chitinophagaceae bacterium]|nr:sugar phosphate isomerase/epimerase [Chitinophagaceae bacterium]MCW5926566.1 sugar phosphate isomerase/epimerase [Chitinophagaceae bacterium]